MIAIFFIHVNVCCSFKYAMYTCTDWVLKENIFFQVTMDPVVSLKRASPVDYSVCIFCHPINPGFLYVQQLIMDSQQSEMQPVAERSLETQKIQT